MTENNPSKNLKITALIPAYNEARNILKVLIPLKQVPAIQEIIVISDGSTDDTVELVRKSGGAKVIALPKNLGKTQALARGVSETAHATLLLCDADLINLTSQHFSDLIDKYCEGYDMVIMDKGGQPWVFKHLLKSVPAMSGTRIIKREDFLRIPFRQTDRFQFENRINAYYLENNLSIAVSPANEVHDTRKYKKYPFLKGLVLDAKGGFEVLASDGPTNIIKNLANFRKVKSLASNSQQKPGHS